MEENKNPLQNLIDVYQESVDEQDKKGFADIYKDATEDFFKNLNEYLQKTDLSFTPTDVNFGDGYFVFGKGTNSTVSFHVKEAPGWLFGIWWSALETDDSTKENPSYRKDAVYCEFFVQYEKEIDKFKPSASMFSEEFTWKLGEEDHLVLDVQNRTNELYHCEKVVRLILTYPYVAWYREMHYANFNVDYVTPEEAKEAFDRHERYLEACERVDELNRNAMLDLVVYLYKPMLDSGDCFIKYDAWCSPSYHVIMRNIWKEDRGQEDSEDGHCNMWDFDYLDKEADKSLWENTVRECEERAKKLNHYWWNPVANWVTIKSGDSYWDLKKEYADKFDYPEKENNNG